MPLSQSYSYKNGYQHARAYSDINRVTSEKRDLALTRSSWSTQHKRSIWHNFHIFLELLRNLGHPHTSYTHITSEQMNANGYPETFKLVAGMQSLNTRVDKKNQLDVTFCILYFSSNSFSTCLGQPCAHHQELTTA